MEIKTHETHTQSHTHTQTHTHRRCLQLSAHPLSVGLRTELASISHAPASAGLLTQIYCKEMAAQIGMHVHVNVAPGEESRAKKHKRLRG